MTGKGAKERLDELTSSAYQRFADYPAPDVLSACVPHCLSSEAAAQLCQMTVADIPASLLSRYNFAALDDMPMPIEEMKHFLPRYLDLLVSSDDFPDLGIETALRGVGLAEWPTDDHKFLQEWAVTFAVVEFGLYDDDYYPEYQVGCDEVLIMLSNGGFDLSEIFTIWAEDPSLGGLLAYLSLAEDCEFSQRQLHDAFNTDAANDAVFSWICDPATVTHFRDSAWRWAMDHENPALDMDYSSRGYCIGTLGTDATTYRELCTVRQRIEDLWAVLVDGWCSGSEPGSDYAQLLERLHHGRAE